MSLEDYITGEKGGIPWAQAATFFVELKDVAVPEPVLTKQAKAGLLKLAHIRKIAQTPEEVGAMQQEEAMTDPNVVAAMDYQEMAAERAALQQTLQNMQEQTVQAQQAQQIAEQQLQELSANTEALQGQLEQANAGRQMAVEQAVMAKDEALSEVVNQQQHREQIMQAADQLALQLKQVAATSPNEAMAQQQQAAAEQEVGAQGAEGAAGGMSQSAKAKKETAEAQQAAVNAQVQGQQAQQAQQADAAKAQATQQQQGSAGAPIPKQSSDSVREAVMRVLLEKQAFYRSEPMVPTRVKDQLNQPSWKRENDYKKRGHFEDFLSLAEQRKGKPLTNADIDAAVNAYNKVTGSKIPLVKDWRHGHLPRDLFVKTAASTLGLAGRLAYAGGGAALGAGHAAIEQARHGKKFGKDKATNAEIERRADYMVASVKARRDPTYVNKLRAATAKYKEDLERADRQHPGGAIARGAVKGALIGSFGGRAAHSMGGRIKALVKAKRVAGAAAKAAAKAAK